MSTNRAGSVLFTEKDLPASLVFSLLWAQINEELRPRIHEEGVYQIMKDEVWAVYLADKLWQKNHDPEDLYASMNNRIRNIGEALETGNYSKLAVWEVNYDE